MYQYLVTIYYYKYIRTHVKHGDQPLVTTEEDSGSADQSKDDWFIKTTVVLYRLLPLNYYSFMITVFS